MKTNKAETILKKIQKEIGGYSRISNNFVPHLLIKKDNITYSICYFGGTKSFRIFYPYPSFAKPQHKIDVKLKEDIIAWFNGEKLYKILKKDRIMLSRIKGKYAGYKPNKIFGTLDCKSGMRMKKENRVFFHTYEEAIRQGYKPCKNCKPDERDLKC